MWFAPDTPPTQGGITILLKSRYPTDAHPAAKPAPSSKSKKKGK